MTLAEFNALPKAAARAALAPCLAVPRWVSEIEERRPYVDVAALLAQATASAQNFTDDELAAALSRHPRIGEAAAPVDHEAALSRAEQAGVTPDDESARLLVAANRRYEERFDRVFLIRAEGRTGGEILDELNRRLDNDDDTERREVVTQLREIALLRLHKVVGE